MRLTIEAGKFGAPISPMMHGVFFEDINYGADGGLYAELVQNRSFEHADSFYAWEKVNNGGDGEITLETDDPLNVNNKHFVRFKVRDDGEKFGLVNSGFEGIPVEAGKNYRFSLFVRRDSSFRGYLSVVIEDENGAPLGEGKVTVFSPRWKKANGTIRVSGSTDNARLAVLCHGKGQLDIDFVSLFPEDTYNQRENGLRADMVQMLADMKPGFVRFPGGCIVEGKNLANAYRWKDTVGDPEERTQNWNRWMNSQEGREAPQYYQSYGLGFYEYFLLCEDIGAEPVPVINCGMSCQFQDGELAPIHQLKYYVQDALDLIEFANGPTDSKWGGLRAKMGHTEPFGLKYLGVGNEQWGEEYFNRYQVFYDEIKKQYPYITLITSSGPGVDDDHWELAWRKFKTVPADIVDEHYYRPPRWFQEQSYRYDSYDRSGPKVFAGEFAAHDAGKRNTLECALSEAAFMTGLLRNADVVTMACYAPLFNKIGFSQWTPDLIWFDNTRIYATPSYHVQKLFSLYKGDTVLSATVSEISDSAPPLNGMIGVGTWGTQAEFDEIKVVAEDGTVLYQSDFQNIGMENWITRRGDWKIGDNGFLQQLGNDQPAEAYFGDHTWTNYTLTLKARKLDGNEGFLISFAADAGITKCWWNIGGWGNTNNAIDYPGISFNRINGRIETGRLYELKVEVTGPAVKCYIDGQLIQQGVRQAPPVTYSLVSLDRKTNEVIVKLVNVTEETFEGTVDLQGWGSLPSEASVIMLTSENMSDENSMEEPDKVAPTEKSVAIAGTEIQYTFPPHSFTLMRIPLAGGAR